MIAFYRKRFNEMTNREMFGPLTEEYPFWQYATDYASCEESDLRNPELLAVAHAADDLYRRIEAATPTKKREILQSIQRELLGVVQAFWLNKK